MTGTILRKWSSSIRIVGPVDGGAIMCFPAAVTAILERIRVGRDGDNISAIGQPPAARKETRRLRRETPEEQAWRIEAMRETRSARFDAAKSHSYRWAPPVGSPIATLVVLGRDPYCAQSTLETETATGTVKWLNPQRDMASFGLLAAAGTCSSTSQPLSGPASTR